MSQLDFRILGAEPLPYAATPQLALKLEVRSEHAEHEVQGALLECQVRIEPAKRTYSEAEALSLHDLFGERERWSRTLRGLLWTQATLMVPAFSGQIVVDLPLPCSYDFTLAATKYFNGVEQGEVPLLILYSGSVFYEAGGALQMSRVSWSRESTFGLPLAVYRQALERHYPNQVPLTLGRDLFDKLHRYKSAIGVESVEAALEGLLSRQGAAE